MMTSFGVRVTGWAAIAAPLLLGASTIAYLVNGDGLSNGEVAGAVQIWAFIAFGVAIVGLARLLESTSPRLAGTLTVLGIIGVAGGVAYGVDSIQVAFLHTTVELGDSAVAPLALRIPGIAFPLTLLVLGIALARQHAVPTFAAASLVLGALLFPPARIGDIAPLAVASDLLLLLGSGAIGVHLLTHRETSSTSGSEDRQPTAPGVAA